MALVQVEHGSSLVFKHNFDLVVASGDVYTESPSLTLDSGHVLYRSGRLSESIPCGTILRLEGLNILVECYDCDLMKQHRSVDLVIVLGLVWGRPGEARAEARRLVYRLMTLSYLLDAPVLFTNVWGVSGSRVYVGYTGLYDYSKGEPIHLGVVGDGWLSIELG